MTIIVYKLTPLSYPMSILSNTLNVLLLFSLLRFLLLIHIVSHPPSFSFISSPPSICVFSSLLYVLLLFVYSFFHPLSIPYPFPSFLYLFLRNLSSQTSSSILPFTLPSSPFPPDANITNIT